MILKSLPIINTNLVRSETTCAAVSKDTSTICNFPVSQITVFGLTCAARGPSEKIKRRPVGIFGLWGPNPVSRWQPLPHTTLMISELSPYFYFLNT